MKKITICLLVLNFQLLQAQELEWFEGSVVLQNDEVRVGTISLEAAHDLILFQEGASRMVYPAHAINSIYFYDKAANINRRYIARKINHGVQTSYQFYEIVISGDVSVLRRQKNIAFKKNSNANDYNYFTLYKNQLTPLNKFEKEIYPQLRLSSNEEFEAFHSTYKPATNELVNSIQIIEFYNSIVKDGEPMARN